MQVFSKTNQTETVSVVRPVGRPALLPLQHSPDRRNAKFAIAGLKWLYPSWYHDKGYQSNKT